MLILDRSVDPLAALARHWTYGAGSRPLAHHRRGVVRARSRRTPGGSRRGCSERAGPALGGASGRAFLRRSMRWRSAAAFGAAGVSRVDASSTTGSMRRVVENLPRFVEAQAAQRAHERRREHRRARGTRAQRDWAGGGGDHLRRATSKDIVARRERREGGGGAAAAAPGAFARRTRFGCCSCTRRRAGSSTTLTRGGWLTGLTAATSRRWRIWRGWACAWRSRKASLRARVGGVASAMTFRRQRRRPRRTRGGRVGLHRFLPTAHHLALALDRGTPPGGVPDPRRRRRRGGRGSGAGGSGNPFESRENSNTKLANRVGAPGSGSGVPGSPARGPGGGGGGGLLHTRAPPKTPGKTPGIRANEGAVGRSAAGGDAEFGFDAANAARESDASGGPLDEIGATTNAAGTTTTTATRGRRARSRGGEQAAGRVRRRGVSFGETRGGGARGGRRGDLRGRPRTRRSGSSRCSRGSGTGGAGSCRRCRETTRTSSWTISSSRIERATKASLRRAKGPSKGGAF